MENISKKKVYMLGLDALSPSLVERFVQEGICPNFQHLMENGGFSRALSAIPAQTPENWTTIATGTWPGVHSIAVWGSHHPGEPVSEKFGEEAMASTLCQAEYLWEAASRQGLGSVLLYFIGYPQTVENVIHIDWFWRPDHFYFELSPNCMYIYPLQGDPAKISPWERDQIYISLVNAQGWENLPESDVIPLETSIAIMPKLCDQPLRYPTLIIGDSENRYNRCIVCKSKNIESDQIVADLRVDQWSEWFQEQFLIDDIPTIGTVRFKLVQLATDGSEIKLYRSQIFPITGFSYPAEISGDLTAQFGPYINDGVMRSFHSGAIDEATFWEEMEYQTTWIAKAALAAMKDHNASLYMMHWHLIDWLQHDYLSLVDPIGGNYDPDTADEAWRILRQGYKMADKFVGKFLSEIGEDDYLIVLSDHGNAPDRKKFSLELELANRGLVKIVERAGNRRVDWLHSKVFVDLTNIYVNLKSRYKNGIVEDDEYETIVNELLDLRGVKDQDGEYVLSFVLKRSEAPMIGLWGDYVGDIVFVYNSGFSWGPDKIPLETGSIKGGGANHGSQIPTTETSIASNYATFMIIGKEIKKGYLRPFQQLGPIQLVDVAPTIAHILGILPPYHVSGHILYDFFEGWDTSLMKRAKNQLEFPVYMPLVGDVTDAKKDS